MADPRLKEQREETSFSHRPKGKFPFYLANVGIVKQVERPIDAKKKIKLRINDQRERCPVTLLVSYYIIITPPLLSHVEAHAVCCAPSLCPLVYHI